MRAVLFGYFRASKEAPGDNLPGQVIFTCLSHDIIAHEVTHAVVDRLRPYFNVASNPHVRAFHEGFADIVAVFQRLSFRDLVQRAFQEQSDLRKSKSLSDIAAQFGQGLGSGKALRTALNEKTKIQDVSEEHDLGAVLVSPIFQGFLRHLRTAFRGSHSHCDGRYRSSPHGGPASRPCRPAHKVNA